MKQVDYCAIIKDFKKWWKSFKLNLMNLYIVLLTESHSSYEYKLLQKPFQNIEATKKIKLLNSFKH